MTRVARVRDDAKHITLKRKSYNQLVQIRGQLDADTWEETIDKIAKRLEECEKKKYQPVY